MVKLKSVVFDLDDTLHLELDYIKSGLMFISKLIQPNDYLSCYNDLMDLFNSKDSHKVFDVYLSRNLSVKKEPSELVKIYRGHMPQIILSDDTKSLFNWLNMSNILMGIISDGYLVSQANKIKALNLYNYVNLIILTDVWGRDYWKPHLKSFIEYQELSKFSGTELVYVGDNVIKDFIAPNQLGWRTIQFEKENQIYAHMSVEFDEARPQYVVSSYKELKDLIRSWI